VAFGVRGTPPLSGTHRINQGKKYSWCSEYIDATTNIYLARASPTPHPAPLTHSSPCASPRPLFSHPVLLRPTVAFAASSSPPRDLAAALPPPPLRLEIPQPPPHDPAATPPSPPPLLPQDLVPPEILQPPPPSSSPSRSTKMSATIPDLMLEISS
jgi:hypothetical protein